MKSGSEEAPQLILPCDTLYHGNTWLCIFSVECILLSRSSTLRTKARKKLFNKGRGIVNVWLKAMMMMWRGRDAHRNGVTERAASSSHLSTSAWPTQSGTFSGGNIAVLLDFFQIASPPLSISAWPSYRQGRYKKGPKLFLPLKRCSRFLVTHLFRWQPYQHQKHNRGNIWELLR